MFSRYLKIQTGKSGKKGKHVSMSIILTLTLIIRYQGLDNLFGLFTKMDAAFQTEWLKLLSHLGPVFSYFVGCLWDKEVSYTIIYI